MKPVHFQVSNDSVNEETPDWQIRCQFKRRGHHVAAALMRRWLPITKQKIDSKILD